MNSYIMIDGDDVGGLVESRILCNDVQGFILASSSVESAVAFLEQELDLRTDVEVLSVGGDSLLLRASEEAAAKVVEVVRECQEKWHPLTFSGGVGGTLRESFLALRAAKAFGKSRFCFYSDLPDVRA